MSNLQINLHHVTRVEGHGNITVEVRDNRLESCRFDIVETPRFFEAMLRGRPYQDASHITSRICGICAVGHATTSLRATENALGITPTEQTVLLRKLNFFGEILDSHVLHVMMLVAPDLLGLGSVIPLARTAPAVVERTLRMKKLAGDLCRAICGRHTHPLSMTVGGFTQFPAHDELIDLRTRLEAIVNDVDETVDLIGGLTFPNSRARRNMSRCTSRTSTPSSTARYVAAMEAAGQYRSTSKSPKSAWCHIAAPNIRGTSVNRTWSARLRGST